MNGGSGATATADQAAPVLRAPASVPAALAGRTVLVTRPLAQSEGLAAAIRAQGGAVWLFPAIEVLPVEGFDELDRALGSLASYDLVVFVSINAVSHAAARAAFLGCADLSAIRCAAAPGPATAVAARQAGCGRVIVPETRFDSEGLVAALGAAGARVARVLILRGASTAAGAVAGDGRELLHRWLRAQGALVDSVACYRRRRAAPAPAVLAALAGGQTPDAIVITSSEGARHLAEMVGRSSMARLQNVPAFVPHARIGVSLRELGMRQVHVTAGGDAGVMRGLTAHFGGRA
ncbi:MAG: uroporphyrinogen-III synthase [Burkholderiales bacterium]|nr:uroporphyrinogen-III synthase [Burkholderiales bacterium]